MLWKDLDQQPCPIARSLSILGDRWTLLIVRDCFLGVRRFEAFQSSLNISRTILRDRLGQLLDAGILMRHPYQDNPVRHDYLLTAKGKGLSDAMLVLAAWGNAHLGDNGAPLVRHVHKLCGHVFAPMVTCSHCGDGVSGGVVTQGVS